MVSTPWPKIRGSGAPGGAAGGGRRGLQRPAQLAASLRLTRWLRCRYGIALKNVIGHNESLSSPYHHDRVPAFQHQTHSDWNHADMTRYRSMLQSLPCR